MKIDFENLTSEQTEDLNTKARGLLVEYTEFVDFYSKKYGGEKYWWCLPMVCRNLFISNVFQQLCRVLLAIDYVRKNSSINKIRVLTMEEKQCLEEYFKRTGNTVKVCCRNKREWLGKIIAKAIYIYLRYFIGEYISIKKVLKEQDVPTDSPINLIVTPVLSSCVGEDIYTDRYFNDIHELSGEELYFLPHMNINDETDISDYVRRLQNVKNYNFILGEQFLKFHDYLRILLYWGYCFKNTKRNFLFQELDVTPLVQRSMIEGVLSTPSYRGILDDRILYRMKQSGIDIRNFIVWYEGRPVDVCNVRDYKRYYPKGNCVAYGGFPFFDLDMENVPSKEMVVQRIVADIYAVPGEAYIKTAKKYESNANYMAVPILRNEYLVKKHMMNHESKKILFILSYFRKDTVKQIEYANAIAKRYGDGIKIILKNHPINSNDRAEELIHDKLYFYPEYVTGTLGDCLDHVDVVVICGGTTSALEVLYASIKLVIMVPNGEIATISVPPCLDREMYSVTYNKKQFMGKISELVDIEGEWYNESLEGFLEPKTREGVRRMFQ